MKIDKQQKKELIVKIKDCAKRKGFKTYSNSLYCKKKNYFFHCDYLIINNTKLIYNLYVKMYSYDDIFWDIMCMENNKSLSDSFRAVAAFKAPSVLIYEGEIEFGDNMDLLVSDFWKSIEESSLKFVSENNVDDYVINNECGYDSEITKCLAYIHKGEISEAVRIANENVTMDKSGAYINSGKSFFELLVEKYS